MSRRHSAAKRQIDPDPVYQSHLLAKFINKVMNSGRKSIARRIVYRAIERFAKQAKVDNPLAAFEQALENTKPSLEVKSRRIGGATYQVPVEIPAARRVSLAIQWIITYANEKVGKSMEEGLAHELFDCFNNQGASIKKKDEVHKMAEANRAFAHYKW
jgi:small subunit ribosomal protein S7